MSKLAGVLMQLRAKARVRPGNWQKIELRHGLNLAWKCEANNEEHFALNRAQVMPSVVEERVCLEHMPEELAPRSRTRHPEKNAVLYILREHFCAGCGNPLEVLAKLRLRELCLFCPDKGEKLCRKCGRVVENRATFTDFCNACVPAQRAQFEATCKPS